MCSYKIHKNTKNHLKDCNYKDKYSLWILYRVSRAIWHTKKLNIAFYPSGLKILFIILIWINNKADNPAIGADHQKTTQYLWIQVRFLTFKIWFTSSIAFCFTWLFFIRTIIQAIYTRKCQVSLFHREIFRNRKFEFRIPV